MMYLNDFSVRVPGGRESGSGYVELKHGQKYSLVLRNSRNVRCDAKVEIDGQHVGTWRVDANGSISLERPVHDDGRFTFYAVGTREAQQANLNEGSSELGLIKVTFTPELKSTWSIRIDPYYPYVRKPYTPPRITTATWGGWDSTNAVDPVERTSCYTSAPEASSGRKVMGGTVTANCNFVVGERGPESVSFTSHSRAGGTGLSGVSGQTFYDAPSMSYDYAQQTTIHLRLILRKDRQEPRPLTQKSNPVPPRTE